MLTGNIYVPDRVLVLKDKKFRIRHKENILYLEITLKNIVKLSC